MSTYELILCSKMKMKDPKTTFLQKFKNGFTKELSYKWSTDSYICG